MREAIMWFMFVIPFVIFFVVFLFIAKSMFRSHKKVGDTMQKMIEHNVNKADNEIIEVYIPVTPAQPVEPKHEEVICEYCGESVHDGQRACPSCGARVKRKTK